MQLYLFLFSAALWGQQPNTLSKAEATAGWRLLFDGASLSGWDARSTFDAASTGNWSARDGALICPGNSPGWIGTSATFQDFTLRLEFRGTEKVNSGVFLRSQREGAPHQTGYELQIWDYQPQGYLTGSLVGSVKAGPAKVLGGQWNKFEVTARGDHFVVVLNGAKILDARDAKHSSGVVGFQCQKDNPIEFRNIKLLPLRSK
ncbi:MAG: DUF1080 domain-containing protein [Bryobacterales bacterium]|nr:DUF1080 domain-containing protein [Bryobacterales bacterium]